MPASYPGQQWRHGWIPMTGGAEKSKNHGRTPGKNSAISRAAAEAGAVLNRMKAQDAAKKSGAKPASKGDAKPSKPAPKPSWPAGKSASKPQGKAADKPTPGDKADAAKPKVGWPKGGDKPAAKTPAKPAAKAAPPKPAPKAAAKTPVKQDAPKGDAAAPKGGGTVSDAAAKQHVLAAVGDIMPGDGKWASMTALRNKLGDMPRDQQDRLLRDLMVSGKVDLERIAILNDVPLEHRGDAIIIGSKPNYQVRLSAESMASAPKSSWPAGKGADKPSATSAPAGEKPAAKPKIGWPSKPGDKPAEPKPAPRAAGKHAAKPPAAPAAPKAGAKVGTDSHGKPLAVGDEVKLTGGRNQGKTGKVVDKGPSGQVKVDTGDGEVTEHGMNVRSAADHAAAKKAGGATRQAAPPKPVAGAPASAGASTPIPEIQDEIQGAYEKLASSPGAWVSLTRIRAELGKSLPKARVDEALTKLSRRDGVYVIPASNRKTLTEADRAAAVIIGDQEKHSIAFK